MQRFLRKVGAFNKSVPLLAEKLHPFTIYLPIDIEDPRKETALAELQNHIVARP